MRGESGQVTMFFIIGLVLLFTVGIFYLMNNDGAESANLDSDVLNSYIRTCVDTIAEGQLKELGMNGGIWQEDANAFPTAVVNGRKVLYAVSRNSDTPAQGISPYAYPAPRYPDWGLSIANSTLIVDEGTPIQLSEFQDGYFGDTNLPELCRSCSHRGIGTQKVKGANGVDVSVEEALEQRIQQSLQTCINSARFSQQTGQEVVVRPTETKLSFTQHAVLLDLKYEVDNQDITFSQRYSIRYQSLLLFAQELAREETVNVSFRPERDYARLESHLPGFTVSAPQASGTDTLYQIKDAESVIGNNQYTLQFLVEQRPPMLDWITRDKAIPSTCANIAADPDGTQPVCGWNTDQSLFFATDGSARDCIRFNADGSPDTGSYSC